MVKDKVKSIEEMLWELAIPGGCRKTSGPCRKDFLQSAFRISLLPYLALVERISRSVVEWTFMLDVRV